MSESDGQRKQEQPSTYVVQDRSSEEEHLRLIGQDQLTTQAMGGVFSEQADPTQIRRVLDIGCGPGGWIIEAAQQYPTIDKLMGIDISQRMINYARTEAEKQGMQERVEFHVMDALLILEFPADYFDLVNLRFGVSFLRTWDWPKMFSEMQRMCRPGGVIRVTEGDIGFQSDSSALMKLFEMLRCAFHQAGHLYEPAPTGLVAHMERLMTQHGCEHVQAQRYMTVLRPGTAALKAGIEDIVHIFRTVRPFMEKWGCGSKDYDSLYQQALVEMHEADFQSSWNLLTVWGSKPMPA